MKTKFSSKILMTLAAMLVTICMHAQNVYYINSNVFGYEPWGSSTNIDAMNTVFGAGGWTQDYFETCDPVSVFSASTCFVFLEGGDFMADELESFFSAQHSLIQSWVAGGGKLLMNSAPNEGDGMNYGFGGVILSYWGGSDNVTAALPLHAIFNGPFLPVGTTWTGTSFSHASVSGGGVTNLIVDTFTPTTVALAEKAWGAGTVLFGGMTTNNFHSPTLEAANLRANILAYLSCGAIVCNPTVPTGLFSDNITTTTAKLHWNSIAGVDKYAVNVYTTAGVLVAKKKTAMNSTTVIGLTPGTDYLFRVRSLCLDAGTSSAFSPPSFFTTPLRTGDMEIPVSVSVYPNPSEGIFNLVIEGNQNDEIEILISGITGQIVYTEEIVLQSTNETLSVNAGNLPAGIYHVKVQNQNSISTTQIIIQ